MFFYFWTEVLAFEDTVKAKNDTLELCSFGCLFQFSRMAKYGTNNRAIICNSGLPNFMHGFVTLSDAIANDKIVLTPIGMYRVDKRQGLLESFWCDVL